MALRASQGLAALLMWCSVLCKDGAVTILSGHVDGTSRQCWKLDLRHK